MKKIINSKIFLVILTAVICISATAYASGILASNVTYKDTTVDKALDDLYDKANTTITGLNSQISTLQTQNQNLTSQYNSLLSDYTDNLSGTNVYSNSEYSDTRGTSNLVSVELPSGKYICSSFIASSASSAEKSSSVSSPVYSTNPTISNCDSTINLNSNKRQIAKELQSGNAYYLGFDISYTNFICEVNSTKTITVNFTAPSSNNFISTGRTIICNKIK